MKNSINLAFGVLFLIVLGCSCPRLSEIGRKDPPRPASTPFSSNSTNGPTPDSPTSSALTMAKYNQLKTGMARSEVERILGGPGTEISSTSGGSSTFSVDKWQGENYSSIIISFRNDKILSKSQVGLK
jgi:outer membrane protein assembly factor BamE (lipoprotein component of BamABCDE complex)